MPPALLEVAPRRADTLADPPRLLLSEDGHQVVVHLGYPAAVADGVDLDTELVEFVPGSNAFGEVTSEPIDFRHDDGDATASERVTAYGLKQPLIVVAVGSRPGLDVGKLGAGDPVVISAAVA